jgi:hypothetical protein
MTWLLKDAPQFLDGSELAAEIAKFAYRPGWNIEYFADPFEGHCVYITMRLPDATDPTGERMTDLRVRSNLPPIERVNPSYLKIWMWHRLDLIERHECREFLRYDGDQLYDPHKPIEPGNPEVRA